MLLLGGHIFEGRTDPCPQVVGDGSDILFGRTGHIDRWQNTNGHLPRVDDRRPRRAHVEGAGDHDGENVGPGGDGDPGRAPMKPPHLPGAAPRPLGEQQDRITELEALDHRLVEGLMTPSRRLPIDHDHARCHRRLAKDRNLGHLLLGDEPGWERHRPDYDRDVEVGPVVGHDDVPGARIDVLHTLHSESDRRDLDEASCPFLSDRLDLWRAAIAFTDPVDLGRYAHGMNQEQRRQDNRAKRSAKGAKHAR